MKDLYALTGQALAGMAVELVDVERAAAGLLRVTIDRADGVRIEDCEAVSRQLSRVFEVENIDYARLEVGSPGVDRPLRTQADLLRFAGERVEVKLREALGGRKVFVGCLRAPDEASAATDAPVFGLEVEANAPKIESKAGSKAVPKPAQKKSGKAAVNDASDAAVQLLSFTVDEMERARLAPLLNFKGKKR